MNRSNGQGAPFLDLLQSPHRLVGLDEGTWDLLVRQARGANLLARIAVRLDERGLLERVPVPPRDHLIAARTEAGKCARAVRWETECLVRALHDVQTPLVLLKGAAYLLADLPPARGRLFGDVDLLVPEHRIADVEAALLSRGWEPDDPDPYDQNYYRRWMHELPPLRHRERGMVVDVHHTILPRSGRLHPDAGRLIADSRPIPGSRVRVLAPADMVLHAIVHLFQDGEIGGGIRDLLDLHELASHFGTSAGFWESLVPRARELGLLRPLFYGLRYLRLVCGTPIPPPVLEEAQAGRPAWPVLTMMDPLVERALHVGLPDSIDPLAAAACHLLYLRAHWLRMPPLRLALHLARKSLRRLFTSPQERG